MERVKNGFEISGEIKPQVQKATDNQFDSELDLLPEFCHYTDEGCQLASSCLHCPFPHCIHDQPRSHTIQNRSQRNALIKRLHTQNKKNIREIAEQFRISERTVNRVLAVDKPAMSLKSNPSERNKSTRKN